LAMREQAPVEGNSANAEAPKCGLLFAAALSESRQRDTAIGPFSSPVFHPLLNIINLIIFDSRKILMRRKMLKNERR
jgi:hypothetical protein